MAKRRNEEEIAAVLAELPQTPPEAALDVMKGRQKEERLVYRAAYQTDPLTELKAPTALITCTACGRSFHLDRCYGGAGCHNSGYAPAPFGFYDDITNQIVYSGDICTCPECGVPAQALHVSHISRSGMVLEKNRFLTTHMVRGHFVALGWILFKEVGKDGRIDQYVRRYDGFTFVDGRPIRLSGFKKNLGGVSWELRWVARAKWYENGDEYDADEVFIDRIAFEKSEAANSALDTFVREKKEKIRIGAYMVLWNKYPQIENLVRCGLSNIVSEIIQEATAISYGYSTQSVFSLKEAVNHFNTKEVKPHRMLGIDKDDLPLAAKHGLKGLEFYKQILRDYGVRLTDEQIVLAGITGYKSILAVLDEARILGTKAGVIQTINYFKGKLRSTQFLLDYWRMVWEVQRVLPEALMFPKDLQRRHDEAVMQKKVKTDAKISAQIRARAASAAWMAFEDEETGLFIRPAANQEELIHEGEVLSHCVRTYAATVARGETLILFIRYTTYPNMPYYTLEYRDGVVAQNRGRNNCERTPEVKLFEKKWLQYLEDTRNGKRTAEKQAV